MRRLLSAFRAWLLTEPHIKSLERLKVLKAGWISSDGPVYEDWFSQRGSGQVLLGRLREGLAQAWLQEVPLAPDLPEAVLAEEFDFSACMNRFGLDWESAKMATSHKRKTSAGAGGHIPLPDDVLDASLGLSEKRMRVESGGG